MMEYVPIRKTFETEYFTCLSNHRHQTYEIAEACIAKTERVVQNKELAKERRKRDIDSAISLLSGETVKSVADRYNISECTINSRFGNMIRRVIFKKHGRKAWMDKAPYGENLSEFREHKVELISLIKEYYQ